LSPRRLTLLGSAAVLGVAMIAAGPGHFNPLDLMGSQPAHADAVPGPVGARAAHAPVGFADLVAKVKPAVISVRVKIDETVGSAATESLPDNLPPGMRKFFQQFGMPNMPNRPHGKEIITGEGSGFFISPDGYAVTNNHVVDHAKTVQIKTADGHVYKAKVIGRDPKTDLALIKAEADKTFPYVKFADNPPRVGDWVVAVGNPFGLSETVTAGIVSARGRDIGAGTYDNYIQIDAPINKGNSGGPAFNMNGNVIGVNTAIFSPSGGSVGIGFDIPASTAKLVIAQLKEHGYVNHAFLGVQVQPVTTGIAESLGLKEAKGAIVDKQVPDSPAAKAGIKSGDVITAVNGKPVKDSRDLARTIGMMAPGSKVKVAFVHDGKKKTVEVALAKLPNEQSAKANENQKSASNGLPHLGLALAPASDVAGAGDKGVAVVGVEQGGLAAQHGLQTGDVILEVAGKTVANANDVRNALRAARDHGKHDVLMQVKAHGGTRFVAVPVGKA
ncbi:MAG: Do family serine endopeptidase, partial [Pseudolabrys sp.]